MEQKSNGAPPLPDIENQLPSKPPNIEPPKNGSSKTKESDGEELRALNEAPTQPYEPYSHRNVAHPTTNNETLIHILKGSIGTGILAMPDAFKNSGIVVGSIGMYLIAFISTYCFLMLIRSQYEICKKIRKPIISYPETMKYAIRQGPPFLKFISPMSTFLVDGFLILYQLGICCVYAVFIGTSLQEVVLGIFDIDFGAYFYVMCVSPLLMGLTMIRNLKLLAPFSQVANFAMLGGIGIIMYYIFRDFKVSSTAYAFNEPIRIPFFIGTSLFALMAVGVFLTLENNMQNPKDFRGVTGVLSKGMTFVAVLYMLMGIIGYTKYGNCIASSITSNMPNKEILVYCVKLIFAFAIYITYALQCYVPVDIIWNYYMKDHFSKWRNTIVIEYVLRIVCVIITCVLAIAIPYLNLFISLIGALCLSILGLVFPPLIEICLLYPNNYGKFNYILVRNIIIFILGLGAAALGTSLAVMDILKEINSPRTNSLSNNITMCPANI